MAFQTQKSARESDPNVVICLCQLTPYTLALCVVVAPRLPLGTLFLSLNMSTAVQTTNGHANGIDGAKTGPKIKTKNQLRRLKAKQKKAQAGATVREVPALKWNILNCMLI